MILCLTGFFDPTEIEAKRAFDRVGPVLNPFQPSLSWTGICIRYSTGQGSENQENNSRRAKARITAFATVLVSVIKAVVKKTLRPVRYIDRVMAQFVFLLI